MKKDLAERYPKHNLERSEVEAGLLSGERGMEAMGPVGEVEFSIERAGCSRRGIWEEFTANKLNFFNSKWNRIIRDV